jgi:hypothetical protein
MPVRFVSDFDSFRLLRKKGEILELVYLSIIFNFSKLFCAAIAEAEDASICIAAAILVLSIVSLFARSFHEAVTNFGEDSSRCDSRQNSRRTDYSPFCQS